MKGLKIKAIVLAAGKGERLKKFTKKVPKPMLKIKEEVILEHNLKWLKKFGIKEVYINLHYLPEIIENYFGNGSKLGLNIKYSYEKKLLGTAGAVKKIGRWIKDDCFLVIYGDNFYPSSYNLEDFVKFHFIKKAMVSIGLFRKRSEIAKSGVVLLNKEEKITNFFEKPSEKEQSLEIRKEGLINAGLYILNRKIIDYIPDGFSDFGKDVFPKLLKKNLPIYGYIFKTPVIAIDTINLYKEYSKI